MTPIQQKRIDHVFKQIEVVDGVKTIGGAVDLSLLSLTELPDLSDVTINGYFCCGSNQLTSLLGCPKQVNGSFYCSENLLTSLQYCPTIVNGGFYCSCNQLTSLQYAPTNIKGIFNCRLNQLTSLKYCPTIVNGSFYCDNNHLTSLKYAPTIFGEFFGKNNPWDKSLNMPGRLTSQEYVKFLNDFNKPIQFTPIDIDI